MTRIIDGKAFAEKLRADIALRVANLKAGNNITPGLAVILVGNNPASEVYVKNKGKQTREAGMHSLEFHLPDTTSEMELLTKVQELNNDDDASSSSYRCPNTSMKAPSSMRFRRARMSTVFTSSTPACSPPGKTRSCHAHRWAA